MFSMFPNKKAKMGDLISTVIALDGKGDWEEKLTHLLNNLDANEKFSLARVLLKNTETRLAVSVIKNLLISGCQWEQVKNNIFNQLQTEVDLKSYDRFLSFQWGEYTGNILSRTNPLCNNMNTRESLSFARKFQSKLGTHEYLSRSEKSINKLKNLVEVFFSKIDVSYSPIAEDIQHQLSALAQFYFLITPQERNLLCHHQLAVLQQENARQKKMDRQHDLMKSALNGEVPYISIQTLEEVFESKKEANQQSKKLLMLGVRIFDVDDKKSRQEIGRQYASRKLDELCSPPKPRFP